MNQPVYCPRCGALTERRFTEGREREGCPACGFIFYRNPVPAVGVVVALDGNVVLIRRRYEPRAGCWALPAGFMELGESTEDTAIRECHEETGLLVRVDHLLGVYSFGEGQRTGLLIVYAATATGGDLLSADDSTEAGAFTPVDLPSPMAFRTHLQAIDHWRRQTRRPSAHVLVSDQGYPAQTRHAVQSDAPAALGLLLDGGPVDSDEYIAAEALFHDRLHDIDRPILVVEQDGAIVGVALISFHQTLRGWYATLDDLSVQPARRRRRLGRGLVAAAADLARARGSATIQSAFPIKGEGARAFLAACGFGTDAVLALRL
jgi:ADP-ribose pyrophosphatase YjhB (NUDIX family)/GNAT superfamily N-acetyltransferase